MADRDREKEETESIAGASNQPIERRAEPSHDRHGQREAERNRIDQMVARREEKARAHGDDKAGDRKRDQDPMSSDDRPNGRPRWGGGMLYADRGHTNPPDFTTPTFI